MLTTSGLKALLKLHNLRLTKRLGQHHLVDPRVVERLLGRMSLSRDDTVVDIGAGLGALTEGLAQRAGSVVAVDVDQKICALLRERLASHSNIAVVCGDILEFPWSAYAGSIVVGAIPYHITSLILVSLCDNRRAIREAWLILQAEVAERLTAKPSTKAYGRLSVLGQYCWDMEKVMMIARSAFFPQPEVDSMCLRLQPRSQPPVVVADEPLLFEVVKAAFAHRRKTLANCLSGLVSRAQAQTLLRQMGLPPSVRGEQLSLAQFAALASALNSLR